VVVTLADLAAAGCGRLDDSLDRRAAQAG
jgi:hypothetical protein